MQARWRDQSSASAWRHVQGVAGRATCQLCWPTGTASQSILLLAKEKKSILYYIYYWKEKREKREIRQFPAPVSTFHTFRPWGGSPSPTRPAADDFWQASQTLLLGTCLHRAHHIALLLSPKPSLPLSCHHRRHCRHPDLLSYLLPPYLPRSRTHCALGCPLPPPPFRAAPAEAQAPAAAPLAPRGAPSGSASAAAVAAPAAAPPAGARARPGRPARGPAARSRHASAHRCRWAPAAAAGAPAAAAAAACQLVGGRLGGWGKRTPHR